MRVGIICGGKSGEHEVSLLSAYSIFSNIDRNRYQPVLVGVDKNGRFVEHENLILGAGNPRTVHLNPEARPAVADLREEPWRLNFAFPIIHGTYGEDGCLQGFLKMLGLPFAGSDIYASADCMNKLTTKRICSLAGIPVNGFIEATPRSCPSYAQASAQLGGTMFVKPTRLGSSVGISRCTDEQSYEEALRLAFRYDSLLILEENYPGREIEFAVMGNDSPIASPPGEIVPVDSFYSYSEKYDLNSKTQLLAPTQLEGDLGARMAECAVNAYKAMLCSGFARVDLMLKKDGSFILNEINTLPGFTKISMFPALFQIGGISYPEIISRIIELGFEAFASEQKLQRSL